MQIKTGLTLVAGIGIGIFAGMSVSADTREKCIQCVKSRIVEALTGEKWPKKKVNCGPANYKDIHNNPPKYRPSEKKDVSQGWDTIAEEILQFGEDKDAAESWLEGAAESCMKNISIQTLVFSRGSHCDGIWDRYGWTVDEFKENAHVEANIYFDRKPQYEVVIDMRPHLLD